MDIMPYRGYTARIDYDDEDDIFFGRVLGMKAIVGFHGSTVDELRQDFKNAIDFLIDDAQKRRLRNPAPSPKPATSSSPN